MPRTLTIPTLFGRATLVLGEHANLNSLLEQLRDLCAVVDEPSECGAEMRELLEVLRDRLSMHFSAEEDDGYFGSLVSARPALRAAITRLEDEHREFLSTLESLIALAGTPNQSHELARVLNDFFERFTAHERAENAILQDFFLRDDGDSGH